MKELLQIFLLWQLRCFEERIIRKRLSDSFIHNSAIVRLSANSSCVSSNSKVYPSELLSVQELKSSVSKHNIEVDNHLQIVKYSL